MHAWTCHNEIQYFIQLKYANKRKISYIIKVCIVDTRWKEFSRLADTCRMILVMLKYLASVFKSFVGKNPT
jgi:hypothetical protein